MSLVVCGLVSVSSGACLWLADFVVRKLCVARSLTNRLNRGRNMLTRPQSGDRGGGASLTPGGLYHMLLDNTETCVNSHTSAGDLGRGDL